VAQPAQQPAFPAQHILGLAPLVGWQVAPRYLNRDGRPASALVARLKDYGLSAPAHNAAHAEPAAEQVARTYAAVGLACHRQPRGVPLVCHYRAPLL
jgi:hypothetical protein